MHQEAAAVGAGRYSGLSRYGCSPRLVSQEEKPKYCREDPHRPLRANPTARAVPPDNGHAFDISAASQRSYVPSDQCSSVRAFLPPVRRRSNWPCRTRSTAPMLRDPANALSHHSVTAAPVTHHARSGTCRPSDAVYSCSEASGQTDELAGAAVWNGGLERAAGVPVLAEGP